MDDPIQQSYRRQAEFGRAMALPSRFFAPESVDNWRHTRMLSCAQPLVDALPGSRWLTVGDGAYGSDAAYLATLGAEAVASSLVTDTLVKAHAQGLIKSFREENAERLNLEDGAFDFVMCKEAYHHFPRPPIGLYEMLRVARVGVLLIEPLDGARLLDGVKQLAKRLLRGDTEVRFEPSGNFIYRIDIEEMAKLMTASGKSHIAYRRFNDFYMPGLRLHRAGKWSFGYIVTRIGIAVQNLLCRLGLMVWGLGGVLLLKDTPNAALADALRRGGYTLRKLPVNPYAG
jgi:SAM-dependent methyltransferase